MVLGGIGGAIHGAVTTPSKKDRAEAEVNIAAALENSELHAAFATALENQAAKVLGKPIRKGLPHGTNEWDRFATYFKAGQLSILEIDSFGAGLARTSDPSDVQAFIKIHARLIDVAQEEIVSDLLWHLPGKTRHYNEWSKTDATLFVEECRKLLNQAIEPMCDELLLVALPESSHRDYLGLQILDPPPKGKRLVKVKSNQPVLKWAAYEPSLGLGSITNLTYELRIWALTEENDFGSVVYAQSGLAETSHAVAVPLPRRSKFIWSVRANFTRNGRPAISSWAMRREGPKFTFKGERWSGPLSAGLLHKFQTP